MSYLTVEDAIAMGYISEEEAAGMGELGKKKKGGFLKKLGKIHKKLSPVHMIKKAIAPKKKKAAAAPPPPAEVTEPVAVTPAEPSSMPQVIPLTPTPDAGQPIQTMSVPGPMMPAPSYSGGGGSSSPYSSGGTSSMRNSDDDEMDLPEEEVDVDIDEEVPQFSNPRREQAGARRQQERFLDRQTESELNQTGRPGDAEESVDGLGWVIKSTPGYVQKSILPKRSFANTFDDQTNPRRKKKKGGRDEWGRRQVVLSKAAHGLSSRRKKNPQMGGILPETTEGNVGLGVVGGIVFAASDMVPASMRPIVKAGALGALLWGAFKALSGMFGGQKVAPSAESGGVPRDQTKENTLVSAGFIVPARGGSAVPTGFTGGSYPIQFTVTNRGDRAIDVEGQVDVEEFPRVGEKKRQTKSFSSLLKNIKPGETRIVNDPAYPTSIIIGFADAAATLYLRTLPSGVKQAYASTNYTIG